MTSATDHANVRTSTVSPPRQPKKAGVPFRYWYPICLFAATRLFAWAAIASAGHKQIALPYSKWPEYFVSQPTGPSPGYLAVISNWDGQWYRSIATKGYQLPTSGSTSTHDTLWAWAFPPGFPFTVRGLMSLTHLSFPTTATILNLAAGGAAMLILYRLLERTGGCRLAASAVALTCCFITAPLLQAAYSESLALLLVLAVLLCIQRHRYAAALPLVAALSFTRLITPPLAVVTVVHAFLRLRQKAPGRRISRRDLVLLALLTAESVAGIWAWSFIAGLIAGRETGATSRVVSATHSLSLGWFTGLYDLLGWPGVVLLLAVVALLIAAAISPHTQDWGIEARTWLWAYPLYILCVTPVTSGILRYLLLAFPIHLLLVGSAAGDRALPTNVRRTVLRLAPVVVASAVGLWTQYYWIGHSLVVNPVNDVILMP